MPNEMLATVRALAGPEQLSNGGKKYTAVLDNGSMLVTFSEGCFNELNKRIDSNLKFEIEPANNAGMAPKILKVLDPLSGAVIWEPKPRGDFGGGGGGSRYDPSVELAKHACGTAGAICGNVILAHATKGDPVPDVKALVLEAMTEWAPIIHEQLTILKNQVAPPTP